MESGKLQNNDCSIENDEIYWFLFEHKMLNSRFVLTYETYQRKRFASPTAVIRSVGSFKL